MHARFFFFGKRARYFYRMPNKAQYVPPQHRVSSVRIVYLHFVQARQHTKMTTERKKERPLIMYLLFQPSAQQEMGS